MFKHGLFALLIAMAATVSLAQTQPKKGANGGMIVTSQGHPIEFVLKGQDLVFYVSDDDGSPLSTKAMRGRATVQDGGPPGRLDARHPRARAHRAIRYGMRGLLCFPLCREPHLELAVQAAGEERDRPAVGVVPGVRHYGIDCRVTPWPRGGD